MCEYSPDSMESKGSGYEGEAKGSAAESQRILRDYAPCIPVQDSPPEAGANYDDPFEGPPAGPDDPLNQIPWSPRTIYEEWDKHGDNNVNTGPTIPGYGDDTSHMGMPLSMSTYMPQDTSVDPNMLWPDGRGKLEMETWGPKKVNTFDHEFENHVQAAPLSQPAENVVPVRPPWQLRRASTFEPGRSQASQLMESQSTQPCIPAAQPRKSSGNPQDDDMADPGAAEKFVIETVAHIGDLSDPEVADAKFGRMTDPLVEPEIVKWQEYLDAGCPSQGTIGKEWARYLSNYEEDMEKYKLLNPAGNLVNSLHCNVVPVIFGLWES